MESTSKSDQKFHYQFELDHQESSKAVPASFSQQYKRECEDDWNEDLQVAPVQEINNENSNNSYFSNCVIL